MKELAPGLGLGLDAYDRPAQQRAAPAAEYRKPRRVERQATKANRMIEFLAAGNRDAALALVDEQDLRRRRKDPERVVSGPEFQEMLESLEKGEVLEPPEWLAAEIKARSRWRLVPDDSQ